MEDKPLQRRARAAPRVKSEANQCGGLVEPAESEGEDLKLNPTDPRKKESEDRQRGRQIAAAAGISFPCKGQASEPTRGTGLPLHLPSAGTARFAVLFEIEC